MAVEGEDYNKHTRCKNDYNEYHNILQQNHIFIEWENWLISVLIFLPATPWIIKDLAQSLIHESQLTHS